MIREVELLLERVKLVNWKYNEVFQAPQYRFNIFTILRTESDEVNLHSRFLGELLDPKGEHCQECAFLRLFLQQIGIEGFELESVCTRLEYRNIDILITNDSQALVVENKIYAGDQDRQLERYYKTVRQEGYKDIFVVYLTLYADSPSTQSVGELSTISDEVIHCISYADDIYTWLEECIKSAARYPVLRETLVQYQQLVARLTGQSFSKGYIMEIKELLMDEKNIELAEGINQALCEAKIDIQFRFWKDLEQGLRKTGFQIADDRSYYNKYSRGKIERYYKRGERKYYGIMTELFDYDKDTAIFFYIKTGLYLFYGFAAIRNGSRKIAQEPQFDHLARIVHEVEPSLERTQLSLGYRYAKPQLNFKDFNTPDVFALANPEKRQKYVQSLVKEAKTLIVRFNQLYEQEVT